ncbi:DUF6789 family protein [Cellulomonas xiejunii]|uniref:Uncharacterized protein n=1 Tax=Cellulomonas xiejunii TaxID=2968083 RepID=A0ABY5KPW4_9CELL|nr:DUF6789 family protein [Cellulomonas xiejunii]MCC2320045.1 hypothetical protein [Cellulomonas xiejunii]UUI70358.1 hypothetical protein NP048_11105 [Cellulomonas xiejunii]
MLDESGTTVGAPARPHRPALPARLVLGAACCATGAALVAHFLLGLPLMVLVLTTAVLAVAAWAVVLRRLDPAVRAVVARRARIGCLAGVPALVAYDLSRWLLVEATSSPIRPFEAWRAFGELLGAGDRAGDAAFAAGFAFHVVNGLSFATAFGVVLAHRGVLAGIAWGLLLETAMVTFYPGWLGLKALEEFVSITVVGHVVYGATLGGLALRGWRRYVADVSA